MRSFKKEFAQLKKLLDENQRFVLISHIYTDGDALGSLMSFYHLLKAMGKNVETVVPGKLPDRYAFLGIHSVINRLSKAQTRKAIAEAQVILILDISSLTRMDLWYEPVMESAAVKVCIDHHPDACEEVDLKIVDTQPVATCEIIARFFEAQNLTITPQIALALYTGIVSDSGGFRFEGTSPETLAVAARLAERGIDPAWVYRQIFEYSNRNQLRFWGKILSSLESDGVIDWAVVSQKTLKEFNVSVEELNGVIDIIRKDAQAKVFVMFVEKENRQVMVGLRSKDGFDVGQIARNFGGGGHFHAAGFTAEEPLDKVVEKTLTIIRQAESTKGEA